MLKLYCPKCAQNQLSYPLCQNELGWSCTACHQTYPIIDHTTIILKDLATWFSHQGTQVLLRSDLSPAHYNFLLQLPGTLRDAQKQLYRYLHAPKSPLHSWLETELEVLQGSIIDLGCGIGLHHRKDILGIDLNWSLIQHYPGKKMIADIFALPFQPKQFDAVLLLNIFDSITHPYALLQQADALLKNQGTILFSSPFCWEDQITDIGEQKNYTWVKGFFLSAGYDITEEQHDWFLQLTPNSYTTHTCHTIRAIKS